MMFQRLEIAKEYFREPRKAALVRKNPSKNNYWNTDNTLVERVIRLVCGSFDTYVCDLLITICHYLH